MSNKVWSETSSTAIYRVCDIRGSRGGQGVRTPLKIRKNVGFLSNTGPGPLKTSKYEIQCWAIIDLPAKRFAGVPMTAVLVMVFAPSLP